MSTTAHFKGFLFDMDGTLGQFGPPFCLLGVTVGASNVLLTLQEIRLLAVDSTEAVNGAFDQWSHMLGLDPITIKAKSHGVRLVDSTKTWYAAAERPIQAVRDARAFPCS